MRPPKLIYVYCADEGKRALMATVLATKGYAVAQFGEPADFLVAMVRVEPHLILLMHTGDHIDINVIGEQCEALRPHTPLLVVMHVDTVGRFEFIADQILWRMWEMSDVVSCIRTMTHYGVFTPEGKRAAVAHTRTKLRSLGIQLTDLTGLGR